MSVWYLRAALLHLGLGFTLGATMLAAPALQLPATLLRLRPLHAEVVLVGWMVQLAFGVAYWILPRLRGDAALRGDPLAWLSLLLLNIGVLATGMGKAFGALTPPVAGRAAELLAVLAFALHAWPRARLSSAQRRD